MNDHILHSIWMIAALSNLGYGIVTSHNGFVALGLGIGTGIVLSLFLGVI